MLVNRMIYSNSDGEPTEQIGIYPVGTDGLPAGDVIVPDGVTRMGRVFYDNRAVTSVSLPATADFAGGSVFQNAYGLKSITFRGNPTMTNLGASTFMMCKALESFEIPASVTTIGINCFHSCEVIKNVIVPEGIETIGSRAFMGCFALESISLPSTVKGSAMNTSNDALFYLDTKLTDITLGDGWSIGIFISNGSATNYTNILTHDCIVGMFNALADLTGKPTQTITLGKTNLERVSEYEIAIATNKNWTVA